MRHILKRGEPRDLKDWKKKMKDSPQNLRYVNLPSKEKNSIKTALLNEQGYLCAYTLQRLKSIGECHIEHIQPQNNTPQLDLDYANMAACFPKDGGDKSYGYGAPVKAGSPIESGVDFVSPYSPGCESRFCYTQKGEVSALAKDSAAATTIDILQLNHGSLVDLRLRAIETHGIGLRTSRMRRPLKPISAKEARRLANEIMKPDSHDHLEPFCVVLAQVALKYAKKEEARAQRLRAQ